MFALLGRGVARGWVAWLVAWVLLFAIVRAYWPTLLSVTRPGEFDFLPADVPSRQGETVFDSSFPSQGGGSSVVLVVYRDRGKLRDEDRTFVQSTLAPRLQSLQTPDAAGSQTQDAARQTGQSSDGHDAQSLVARVRTAAEQGMGPLLNSSDGKATLVVVELRSDFMSYQALPVVASVEKAVDDLRQKHDVPPGLTIAESGGAVVGRDMGLAKQQSAKQTSFWTVALVIILLVVVYRAPLLTLVPLATLYCGFTIFLGLLTSAAKARGVGLFEGIDVYTMVLAYGVGVDYTLFLISRYREELSAGADPRQATVTTISKVGSAIAAHAATGIFGIGMMAFASFGKLHQAGLSISLSLLVLLCAALTLAPPLLRLGGRWIFWPRVPRQASGGQATGAATAAASVNLPVQRAPGNRAFRFSLASRGRGRTASAGNPLAHRLSGDGAVRRRRDCLLQPRRLRADHRFTAKSTQRRRNRRDHTRIFPPATPARLRF